MSDPITMGFMALSGALGLAGSLAGGGGQSAPPPAQVPAAPAPATKDPGATVFLGDDTDLDAADGSEDPYSQFSEKRASGVALGGLGKSGLGL
jgi:hypothetical protein